jgi:glucose-6-phosphate isomerase
MVERLFIQHCHSGAVKLSVPQGVIWGINSFDQFGVELGKRLADSVSAAVSGAAEYAGENNSTIGLLARIRQLKK